MAALVQEADDRALLTAAFEGWERVCDDPQAVAAYRDELRELAGFESPLPEY